MRLGVRNSGSSALSGVRVTDQLPAGLQTEAGQNIATFQVGTLATGESQELTFNARAIRTGKFTNPRPGYHRPGS